MFSNSLKKITLQFTDPIFEAAYDHEVLPQLRIHSRIAISVGLIIYTCFGLLDYWFIPGADQDIVWIIRLMAMIPAVATIYYTFHPQFAYYNRLPLGLVGLYGGIGLMGILCHLPYTEAVYYYPGLILATFFTYNFVGTRFIYALGIDLLMLISYNIIFGGINQFPIYVMFNHNFFLISANLIGGFAGYMNEYQRRLLFLQRFELQKQKELHYKNSLHDSLTGLPNRNLLTDRLKQAIAETDRHAIGGAGFYIDIDDFKPINDTLGHAVGDRVLVEVARRLSSLVRETDTVSRLGGDEFFILTREMHTSADAKILAEKILHALAEPPIRLTQTSLKASIGICLYPYQGCTAIDLMKKTDEAMYHSKRFGKARYSFANPETVARDT